MTLGLRGHKSRCVPFQSLFESVKTAKVSQCNEYRGLQPGESLTAYVTRLGEELDEAFSRFLAYIVCASVAELVTGASTVAPRQCRLQYSGHWKIS